MKNIFKILTISVALLTAIAIFTSCDQLIDDPKDFFEYWTSEVIPKGFSISGPQTTNSEGSLCVPSGAPVTVTINLHNPRKFKLVMPTNSADAHNIIRFPGFSGYQPEYSSPGSITGDYTLKQTADDKLELTYKSSFLKKHEWSSKNIGPEITFISTDGRKFSKKFSLNLKVDTPPKLSSTVTIGKTASPIGSKYYYVIILKAEDMTQTAGTASELLHKDITTLAVEGGNPENISFTSGYTAFDASGRLLAATDVTQITSIDLGGQTAPPWDSTFNADPWALRYRTDTEVKTASKVYTFTLIDEKGLKSSPITVSTPVLKAEDVQLYHNSNDISMYALSPGSPYTINTESSVIVQAKTATIGAKIRGILFKKQSSPWIKVDDINSDSSNEVNITLSPPTTTGSTVEYKISLTAGGDGFAAGTAQEFYVKVKNSSPITIYGSESNAWNKLKNEVENNSGAEIIKINGTIVAPSSGAYKIEVNRTVKIVGSDKNTDILDADNRTHIFAIYTNGDLTLEKLTLQKGKNTDIYRGGGAIYCGNGKLTTDDVIVKNCEATHKNGGGIYAKDRDGITLKNTKIMSCTAKENGGGLYIKDSTLTLNQTTIDNNKAKNGGGIYFTGNGKTCNIEGGTVSNNEATDSTNPKGGGVYVGTGAVFAMKGYAEVTPSTGDDANVKGKNDIYLANVAKITIAEKLEYERVARITPESYPTSSNPSIQVLHNNTNVAENYFKFTVTRDANANKAYCVNQNGYIVQQVDTTPYDVDSQNWTKLKAAIESAVAGTTTVIYVRDVCYARSGSDTITVDNKTITLIGLTSGHVSLAANQKCRIFTIKNEGKLTIKNMELEKGKAKDGKGGGGILLEDDGSNKSLTLENVSIKSCYTSGSGPRHGAGIAIYKGTVTMKGKTQIWGCETTAANGGGVYIGSGGILTIDGYDTTNNFDKTYIRSCEANKGGGVYIESGGTLNLINGELAFNKVRDTPKTGIAVYNENSNDTSFNWTRGIIRDHYAGSGDSVIFGPCNNPSGFVAD